MALTRVYGRVVYPHGEGTPTPVTGDGVIEYVHATPGIVDGAVHGPDRKRAAYIAGVAEDAWLKPGMWRAYVYPDQGRSYTLHLGIPETGETTIADAVGEVVPDGIVTRGEQGPQGPQGERGPEGPEGPQGPQGPQGIQGEVGPKGDKGDRGEQGLKGATGPASTVPGPAGPPGQVLTPESMLVVGPGRPDVPASTNMTSGAIAALPMGCEYRSTDGAGTGAWQWLKTTGGWTVTKGETGSRNINSIMSPNLRADSGGNPGTFISRTGPLVIIDIKAYIDQYGNIHEIPAGFRPAATIIASFFGVRSVDTAVQVQFSASTPSLFQLLDAGTPVGGRASGTAMYYTRDPWPTTLPGDPA